MKTIKKFVLCLLVVMLLPLNSIHGIAATNETKSTYDIGIDVLEAIGVLSETDIASDKDALVTRAEYAMLMIRLRGWEELAFQNSKNRYFYDVDFEYYETRHINLAASMGIMDSEDDGYFYPEEAVTLETAAKALLTVLGYGPIAKSKGGNASDYIQLATQKGLLKGVNMSAVNISRGDVYKMMVNSLDVAVVAEEAISKENSQYTIVKENTLLTEYHGIYLSMGIVTANDVTSLNADESEAGDDRIEINGEQYKINKVAYSDLLGYKVKYYYKVVDGEYELVYAYKSLNESITIKATDIIGFSNLKYTYYGQNDKKQIADVVGAYFIYNGEAMKGDNEDFIPLTGNVEIIDNNNDGKYDVVKINSYEEYVVTGVSVIDYVIKTKSNVNLTLDEDKVKFINYSNNSEIKLDDLRVNRVISVARNSDGEIIRVISYPAYIYGKIDSIYFGDIWEVEIDEIMYSVSPAFKNAVENGKADNFEIGSEAYFVFNSNNEIAHWYRDSKQIGEDAWTFGLLETAGFDSGLSRKNLKVRIFTITNEFEIFEIKNRVNIDGVKYTDMEEVYKKLCRNGENGTLQDKPVSQLIRFKLKNDGTVRDIDLVGEENPEKEGLFKAGSIGSEASWYYNGTFGGEFSLNNDSVLFLYPAGMDLTDEKKVSYSRTSSGFENGGAYSNLNFYKVNSNDLAISVVCREGSASGSIANGAPLYILLDIDFVIDEDGEVRKRITYANSGSMTKRVLSDDIDLDSIELNNGETYSLKVGDGFRCASNIYGEIVKIQPIYDYENHTLLGKSYNGNVEKSGQFLRPRQSEQFYAGYVNRVQNDILEGVYSLDGNEKFNYKIATGIYIYDSEEEKLITASSNELISYLESGSDCSKVVMRAHWYNLSQIFIIR